MNYDEEEQVRRNQEYQEARRLMIEDQKDLLAVRRTQSCLTCIDRSQNPEDPYRCLRYRTTVPAEVFVHGCIEWYDEDNIPF